MKVKIFDFNFDNLGPVMDVHGEYAESLKEHIKRQIHNNYFKWNMAKSRSRLQRSLNDDEIVSYLHGTTFKPQYSDYKEMVEAARLTHDLEREVMEVLDHEWSKVSLVYEESFVTLLPLKDRPFLPVRSRPRNYFND